VWNFWRRYKSFLRRYDNNGIFFRPRYGYFDYHCFSLASLGQCWEGRPILTQVQPSPSKCLFHFHLNLQNSLVKGLSFSSQRILKLRTEISLIVISRRLNWAGHVASMTKRTVWITEGKSPFGRHQRSWEDSYRYEMSLTEIQHDGVEWIHANQDMVQWCGAVDTAVLLSVQ